MLSNKPCLHAQLQNTIFWIFPIVPCHAFSVWHWPIGKDLDLSFIWGHHQLHIVDLWISVDQLNTSQLATPCWRDPTRSKQLSTVAIWLSRFGLYRVVAPLSFLRGISLASLFTSHSIFGWSDLLLILRRQGSIFVCGPLHHYVFPSVKWPQND